PRPRHVGAHHQPGGTLRGRGVAVVLDLPASDTPPPLLLSPDPARQLQGEVADAHPGEPIDHLPGLLIERSASRARWTSRRSVPPLRHCSASPWPTARLSPCASRWAKPAP